LELRDKWQITEFIYLPEQLQKEFSNLDPNPPFPRKTVEAVVIWIKAQANRGDYALIQGDFGLVFSLVDWSLRNGLQPIYSTSYRTYKEKYGKDGSIETYHHFKHVCFRKYKRLKDIIE